jgi:hypothetical protein
MKNKRLIKRIFKYLKPYSFILILAFFSALVYVFATLYAPMLMGNLIDELDYLHDFGYLRQEFYIYLYLLISCVVIGALFGYVMTYLLNKLTYLMVRDLRIDTFAKINRIPVSYIDSHSYGDLLSRIISDIDTVAEGLLQTFTEALTGIITIVFTLFFMLRLNYKIGLLVVALTPLSLIGATFIAKMSFKTFKAQAEVKGRLTGFVNEMVENQAVIKAYGREAENTAAFDKIDEELYKYGINAQFYSSLANPITRFVNAIIYLCVATFGAIDVVAGGLKVGMLSTFLSYASSYTKPFNSISSVATELQNSFASLRRVFELLDATELPDESGLAEIDTIKGEVSFQDVSFSYKPEVKLIENFSIDCKKGEQIAFVGPTGCGKTTIINLLMRFYDINSGDITVDSKSIYDIKRKNLRAHMGMVLQDTWLFKGTVKENIAYGKDDATDEEIIDAAKRAYAHDFIMQLPHGYDTIISDSDGMSTGQKQLLCIARLMLRIPNVLILDEATSNIDTRTEILISKAFKQMMIGRTSFIIAHRLSTIKNADKIIVMKDGHIMEIGRHEELLAKNGFYTSIYNSQFQVK